MLEVEKRGPALKNRLVGDAEMYKRPLDRESLRAADGVKYFRDTLRPHFHSVFLWRFINSHEQEEETSRWSSGLGVSVRCSVFACGVPDYGFSYSAPSGSTVDACRRQSTRLLEVFTRFIREVAGFLGGLDRLLHARWCTQTGGRCRSEVVDVGSEAALGQGC